MLAIGIEGTAHTVGVGLVDESCNILANRFAVYSPTEGGIHPREAANFHAEKIVPLMGEALEKASLEYKDLDLVAFSQGPGLGPCLRTVATAARALSVSLDLPIIGVNHCVAHLEIGRETTGCSDPVLLYVSGGNTQVIAFSNKRYRVFGETLDIGIGNLLDKFGREIGFPFPCGPRIERLAERGGKLLNLPYSVMGMDVAFSGILTAALQLRSSGADDGDLSFSMQETAFSMLTEVSERAMAHVDKDEILLGGGVAQNGRLQSMISRMAEDRGGKMFVPAGELCVDNGAMIAWTGLLMHKSGTRMSIPETVVKQRFRTDEVDVTWLHM
ncbi:MAG: bifunctional N(6)-L-threonylcarbamoyladenine synthase/serine/threonine protein kinase [Thermoplasmata archaeon]